MPQDKLELKIIRDAKGKDVELDNMSLAASRSFLVLLESLTNIIDSTPNNDSINIQILKGSATLVAQGSTEQIGILHSDFDQVITNKSSNKPIVENWRNIQSLFMKNGLEYEANFYSGNKKVPVYNAIKKAKSFRTKFTRVDSDYSLQFIEGQLIEVGGKNPNIHILDNKNNKLTISCSEKDAIRVNSFLYKKIYLSVWSKAGKGKKTEYSYCDFYQDKQYFDDFKRFMHLELEDTEFLIELHYKIKSFLDEKNYGSLKKFLRLFNHISHDVSTLKTILVITKSFRENEQLKDSRLELKQLLEYKLGQKLI